VGYADGSSTVSKLVDKYSTYQWVPVSGSTFFAASPQLDASENFYFIENERSAYEWMVAMQNLPNKMGKEIVGILSKNLTNGKNGILILPWARNGYDNSNSAPGYHGTYYEDYDGVQYTILGMVHTHPDNELGPLDRVDDVNIANNTFRVPSYILGEHSYVQYYPASASHTGSTYDLINPYNPISLFPKR
jgi:hypothetical protein